MAAAIASAACTGKNLKDHDDKAKPAGHVKHDASGRAVWEWAADTGRMALDSTSRLLKRLDLPGLKLEENDKKQDQDTTPKAAAFDTTAGKDPFAGKKSFNPYDNRAPPKRGATPRTATKPAPRVTQPITRAKKPGFFARLFGRKT
jgi:hypothetical protein